jgi:hypothetical protein
VGTILKCEMNQNKLLKTYIREVLNEGSSVNELSLASLFGKGDSKISSWFSRFLNKKLDKISDVASDYLSSKLSGIIPDKDIRQSGFSSVDRSADVLAVVVDEWTKEMGEKGMKFSSGEKREISDTAAQEFAKSLRKNEDKNAAILQVYRTLNAKYGSKKTK